MIRKVKSGYKVVARSGRSMGTYPTKEKAKKRLAQVEMFKAMKKSEKLKKAKKQKKDGQLNATRLQHKQKDNRQYHSITVQRRVIFITQARQLFLLYVAL